MNCPICDRENDRDARRCRSCGADFEDPDIAAQLDRPLPGEDADGELDLSGGRFLGVRWLGFEVGGDLRRLAVIGGLLFLVVALVPVKLGFGGTRASWSAISHGPKLALLLPFVLAAAGLVLGFAGRAIPAAAAAAVLAAGGAAALAFGMSGMGQHAGTTVHALWLPWFGTAIAAAGVAIRVLRRRDPLARWIVVGGAALVLLGMIIPFNDARDYLPAEFSFYIRPLSTLADCNLFSAWQAGFDNDSMVRFLSLWHLLELALLAVAVAFALRRSTGPWDGNGMVLRPIGFGLLFYLTLTFLLYTVNVMGWNVGDGVVWHDHYYTMSDFTGGMFAGRARLALLSAPACIWLVAGLVGLYANLVAPHVPAEPPAR
ncbi:MAG TPA: hypothetical protein VHE35_24305 [Kofleriaceae bacterium]|nr:hypothetical protein [Kofleriaceae bacterium]